jgi:hypothetical protein
MNFGNEFWPFWLILCPEYKSSKLFAVQESTYILLEEDIIVEEGSPLMKPIEKALLALLRSANCFQANPCKLERDCIYISEFFKYSRSGKKDAVHVFSAVMYCKKVDLLDIREPRYTLAAFVNNF